MFGEDAAHERPQTNAIWIPPDNSPPAIGDGQILGLGILSFAHLVLTGWARPYMINASPLLLKLRGSRKFIPALPRRRHTRRTDDHDTRVLITPAIIYT